MYIHHLNSSTLLRMAVEVSLKRSHGALSQSVSTALAGTVWETMQEDQLQAPLGGQTCLCGVQQRSSGAVGVSKMTGTSEGGAHMGAHRLQGKQAVVFYATKDCSGVLGHKRTPPWDVPGKRPLIHP